ncbi:MAG: thiamine phosphate synthase [Bacteroidaceae bacterium]|jgi:thiamine-phosphate pyrophosphorylase|nr:thiamine phosphate synthase [Bacteroidaceae bacterium]
MLQFITHQTPRYSYVEGAIEALNGGCKWIQLRMKEAAYDEICNAIEQLKPLCKEKGAILILDDYAELAAKLDIDGVHLGKNDMPPQEARNLIGEKYIIGGTANTIDDIKNLVAQGVDYIGLGPFRHTDTKKNLSPILGLDGYKNILSQCNEAGITTPIVAIGGIEPEDIPALMKTGISGIALSGTILRADHPAEATQNIITTLNNL